MTNSLKSSLIPFFARIPIRTGWLGEMRYGLLNDIRYLDKNKNHLMVEKFAALSMKDSNYCLESLSFPKLSIDFENQQSSLVKFGINQDLPCLAICPGAEFGPAKKWPEENYSMVAKNYLKKGWNVLCFGSANDHENEKIYNYKVVKPKPLIKVSGKPMLIQAINDLSLVQNKKVIIRKMEGYKKIREGNLPDGYDASL